MLTYDLAHWVMFFASALLLNLSPGPDIAFILGHAIQGGRRQGTAAMLGIWAGAFGHVLLAALGISAIVAASEVALAVLNWIGAVYLIGLGLQAWRSRSGRWLPNAAPATSGGWAVFRQGVLIDLLNPKVAIFFVAFLPQFVVEGAGPVWAQLLLHGTLIIVVAAGVEAPLVLLADRFTSRLRASRWLAVWLDRTLGTLLIGLGLRLATSQH